MDSEQFYNTILKLLDDPEEKEEVDQLITWWNRLVSFYQFAANTDIIV